MGGSDPSVEMFQTAGQQGMESSITKLMQGLFQPGGAQNLMPTKQWFESLSPEVMQGVWAPHQDAMSQMGEQLGGMGVTGGSMATAAGKLMSEAGRGVGQQAWQMSQPGMMMPYQMGSQMYGSTLPTPIVMPGQEGQGGNIGSLLGMGLGTMIGAPGLGDMAGGTAGGMLGGK